MYLHLWEAQTHRRQWEDHRNPCLTDWNTQWWICTIFQASIYSAKRSLAWGFLSCTRDCWGHCPALTAPVFLLWRKQPLARAVPNPWGTLCGHEQPGLAKVQYRGVRELLMSNCSPETLSSWRVTFSVLPCFFFTQPMQRGTRHFLPQHLSHQLQKQRKFHLHQDPDPDERSPAFPAKCAGNLSV